MKRAVITGIGAVTPIGETFRSSWEAVKKGVPGIGPLTRFDAAGFPWKISGEIKDLNFKEFFSIKEINRLDPFILYGALSASMALEDAGFTQKGIKAGIVIGSSRGGVMTMEKNLLSGKISPYAMHASTVGMAASFIGQKFAIRGHSLGISSACASGMHALGEAVRLIRSGTEKIVLAGGAEAPVTRLCVEGYGRAGALSRAFPPYASRPFDARRDGFVLSEGGAVLILEEYNNPIKRKAKIYGEIIGCGNALSATHETRPDIFGEIRAMKDALKEAGIGPEDIGLIAAHATGTPLGDKIEADAIKQVFGTKTPVIALKSLTGHMLSASSPFEAAVTLMSLRDGVIPPYKHLEENESGLNISIKGKKIKGQYALVNSFGFGGFCASVVLRIF
jgi:3-oxoacyl-[acyl-carrier-protein] synthase II